MGIYDPNVQDQTNVQDIEYLQYNELVQKTASKLYSKMLPSREPVVAGMITWIRRFSQSAPRRTIHVPFQDDLTPVDEDLFNLGDFQHYKESPDVAAHRKALGLEEGHMPFRKNPSWQRRAPQTPTPTPSPVSPPKSFLEAATARKPTVFVSKLTNPYLNLAIEDYIFLKMPLPEENDGNFNRLMFYVNSPCVVVGKNQNPWAETNMALLNSLKLPLVRRRSGGGAVVHDQGNVNYSFMTSKTNFDRHVFAELVCRAVNAIAPPAKHICVTERGDIVTKDSRLKVSGSAYKLAKGRFYHHGTMLLDSNLDVLRQLLRRDDGGNGKIIASTAVASVKSPVTNLHIPRNEFIRSLSDQFDLVYGHSVPQEQKNSEELMDDDDVLGLLGFVEAFSEKSSHRFVIDNDTVLPDGVIKMRDELLSWEWKLGNTMKFSHEFTNTDLGVHVTFHIKKGYLDSFTLHDPSPRVIEAFSFLQQVLDRGDKVRYEGSSVCGFIVDDAVSDWIGHGIDGLN